MADRAGESCLGGSERGVGKTDQAVWRGLRTSDRWSCDCALKRSAQDDRGLGVGKTDQAVWRELRTSNRSVGKTDQAVWRGLRTSNRRSFDCALKRSAQDDRG